MINENSNPFENLLKKVGGQNRYQYTLFLILGVKWIIAGMILFSLNFFYYVPDFACTDEEMIGYKTCEDFVCDSNSEAFWFDHLKKPIPNSISLDYGIVMVCSKEWISSALQSLIYLGSLFGYLVMSHFADNFGRKNGQIIAWIVCIAGQIILLASVNIPMVAIGSFILGFGTNAAITLHYSFFKELILGKTRQRMIIAIQISFSIGLALISLFSYMISSWKIVLATSILIPSTLILLTSKLIEETPEFTYRSGLPALLQSLNRIAEFNGNEPIDRETASQVLREYKPQDPTYKISFIDLFKYTSLRKITIICALVNFTIEFIYDGTILNLSKIGINVYLDQILVGLVEVGAAIFGSYIVPKVKRKKYISIAFGIIAVLSIVMGIQALSYDHVSDQINYHTILEMGLLAILRFLINSIWGIFFVYVAELFPMDVSSLSFAWVSIIGTIGASISPFIRLITAKMTMFVVAILALNVVFMIRFLKETQGQSIRATIQQKQEKNDRPKSIISNDEQWRQS